MNQTTQQKMELMKLNDVSKTYSQGGLWSGRANIQALNHVSLNLNAGECLMLVGASGSGKSTLGRLVLGLEMPDAGTITYKGTTWKNLKDTDCPLFRRNVQAVFQNSHAAVNPRFTAYDIIAEPLRNFIGLKDEALTTRVIELLEKVGLTSEALPKLPHQFSGGELQRICIARALALNPEIIVLDEAVSSLDVINQGRILQLLAHIRQETQTAFLFITHDLRLVGKFADAIAIMQQGQLAYYAPNIHQPEVIEEMQNHPAFKTLAQAIFPPLPPESV